ncbi:unnamed protein product [Effrenium voratum]|nr:unnamed protein product [Effrenium voratum]
MLLGHNASRVSKVIWIMKLVSRLSVAMGGHILPDSHLYLPPHLCSSCCATGRGRLPVVVVRNPFSRLASNWRLTVLLPLHWAHNSSFDPRVQELRRLSEFSVFIRLVERLLQGITATVEKAAGAASFLHDRVEEEDPSSLSLGDVVHFIPVAELLRGAPQEWQMQRKMLLHLEHLEEDLELLAKTLCSGWEFCDPLPSFPHIIPLDEHPRDGWGSAEKSSWRAFKEKLRWTEDTSHQAAKIYAEDFQLLGYDPDRPDRRLPLHAPGVWVP